MRKRIWWRALLAPLALVMLTLSETLPELVWRVWASFRAVAVWVVDGGPLADAYCDCLRDKIASNDRKIDKLGGGR